MDETDRSGGSGYGGDASTGPPQQDSGPSATPSQTGPRVESPRDRSDSFHTPTGWKVVGAKARELLSGTRSSEPSDTIRPCARTEALFGTQLSVRAPGKAGSARSIILEELSMEVFSDSAQDRLVYDEPRSVPIDAYGGVEWKVHLDDDGWVGELLWRLPHPVQRGLPLTRHVIVEETEHYLRLSVRVCSPTRPVRSPVSAGQARPGFLDALYDRLDLTYQVAPVRPRALHARDIPDFVENVLPSRDRTVPVAVLAPREAPGVGYVRMPDEVARALTGLAHLYVIQRYEDTYRLSDAMGDRRLSCYRGAFRIYMPGFSKEDDPYDHPLLVEERFADPVMWMNEVGRLGIRTGQAFEMSPGVDARRAQPELKGEEPVGVSASGAGVGDAHADYAQARGGVPGADPSTERESGALQAAPAQAAPSPETAEGAAGPVATGGAPALDGLGRDLLEGLQVLAEQVADLTRAVTRLEEGQQDGFHEGEDPMLKEIRRLATLTSMRSASTNALERRLERLENLIEGIFEVSEQAPAKEGPGDEEEDEDGRVTLVEVVRSAAQKHGPHLLILDSAEASAEDSPYEHAEKVGVVLDAMAQTSMLRQDGDLGTSLREAFQDLGIDYRPGISESTSKKLRQQYEFAQDGREYFCDEHINLGTSRDPRFCLRIYFTSKVAGDNRFVIGHVGRHFDTVTT